MPRREVIVSGSDAATSTTALTINADTESLLSESWAATPTAPTTDEAAGGASWLPEGKACGGEADDSASTEDVSRPEPVRLSKEQKVILACLMLATICTNACTTILSPFYPPEADSRNVSTATQGWIFGSFSLTQVIMCPVVGKLLYMTGAKLILILGLFFCGGTTVLFGAIGYCSPSSQACSSDTFVWLNFVVRIASSIGCAAYSTAAFAITAAEFPDNLTTMFALLETVCGIGVMIGPALGGALYSAGGFMLPFAVTGSLMVLCCFPAAFMIPTRGLQRDEEETASAVQLLKSPVAMVIAAAVAANGVLWSCLDPLLEPRLRDFALPSIVVGLIFLLQSATYAITSPIIGYVLDKYPHRVNGTVLVFAGFVFGTVVFAFLGPSSLLGFTDDDHWLWLDLVAIFCLGLVYSLTLVPTYDIILEAAKKRGLPDNMSTYGLVGGLWNSVYALGDFTGPVVSTAIYDALDFPSTMTVMAGLSLLFAVIIALLYVGNKLAERRGCCHKSYVLQWNLDDEEPAALTESIDPAGT